MTLVRSMRLRAETYESAQQFLDAFDAARPGCMLLDVRMPGISGLGLLEQFNREEIPLPAIVMSAYGDVPMVVRAMKAGALNFLEKPCRDQQLWEAIQEAIKWDADHRERMALRTQVRHRLQRLTPGEHDVLALLIDGKPNRTIADRVESQRTDHRGPPGQNHGQDEGRFTRGAHPFDSFGRSPLRKAADPGDESLRRVAERAHPGTVPIVASAEMGVSPLPGSPKGDGGDCRKTARFFYVSWRQSRSVPRSGRWRDALFPW